MWVSLPRHTRLSLADRGMLVLSTPTKMQTSRPSTVDHTLKPTEAVGNVGAWDNSKKNFVVNTHRTSKTSNPCPTLV